MKGHPLPLLSRVTNMQCPAGDTQVQGSDTQSRASVQAALTAETTSPQKHGGLELTLHNDAIQLQDLLAINTAL